MKNFFFSLAIFPLFVFSSLLGIQQNDINHSSLSMDVDESYSYTMNTSQMEEKVFSQMYQNNKNTISESIHFSNDRSFFQEKKPKKTPRPTPVPLIIPPPANQTSSNIIVLLGVLSVLIVIIGVLINRSKID